MVKIRVLRYIVAENIYNKEVLSFVALFILAGIGFYLYTNNILNLFAAIGLLCLVLISSILKDYEEIINETYVPTPLIVLEMKYNKISARVDLIKFLDINKEEKLKLETALYEHDRAIELLENENKK